MVKDLTSGKPLKLILMFSLPLVLGNLFQQFYNMADTIIVGKCLGVNALAAVGSTGSLNFLVMGFATGICSGLTIPVAQYFGAKDEHNVRRCVANSLYVVLAITAVLTAATMLFTRQILALMQTPADIFEDAYAYIIVIFGGMGVTLLYNLLSGILRALGDSRTPLYFLVVASLLNVVLDLVFIQLFHTGVAGAAYATVISQGVSALLCLVYMVRKFPLLRIRGEDWSLSGSHVRRMLGIGVPMGLQFSITAVGSIILQSAVNSLGSSAVAAIAAGSKVQMLLTQPLETMGITMATYCGQNMGAMRVDRIRQGIRQATWVSLAYSVLAFGISFVAGKQIALLFLDAGEVQILNDVFRFLMVNGCFYPFLALIYLYRNSLQGLGYAVPAMAAGIFELVGRAAVAFCLVGIWGYSAVCFANPAAWIAADILLLPVYFAVSRRLRAAYPAQA
ncbi:MAG TPA: MATE family efflux transporter [Candidatus Merdivicinus intestinavium]|nr:MATE family efflux transporter [Candidatus Merdivicinus intestinavium]